MKTHRIFVEQQPIHQHDATQFLYECNTILCIESVEYVRSAIMYEIFGIDEDQLQIVIPQVFSELPRTYIYHNIQDMYDADTNHTHMKSHTIAMEYLAGQYDQRAHSAEQCLALLGFENAKVMTGTILILYGEIAYDTLQRITQYAINPIEMRVKNMSQSPQLTQHRQSTYRDTSIAHFISASMDELESQRISLGLSMSNDDLQCVQQYFLKEGRNPTMTEIRILDTYWSDHCRHTTFLTHLTNIEVEYHTPEHRGFELYHSLRSALDRDNPMCLMDIASIGAKYLYHKGYAQDIDYSEEVNACSMHTKVCFYDGREEDWLLMFKNETHNHPTEIEPYGGASTCLGGAIRDPLSGRSYVFSAMRVSGSADPRASVQDTLAHKLPQRYITRTAASGFSSYGNQVGLATPFVKEIYHQGYQAKRLEAGFVMGAAPLKSVVRERPQTGDIILLVGGNTGRDGIGGAVGSSKVHTETSLNDSYAEVQKGNPLEAHALQRLFRNPKASRLIKRCNDFGAGGIAVAVGELADGVEIYLDKVPLKYEGLDGTELAISESQERMAVVLQASDMNIFLQYAHQENVMATHIATVIESATESATATPRMRMWWKGKLIVDIARSFLDTNGASRSMSVIIESAPLIQSQPLPIQPNRITKAEILQHLQHISYASQHGLQQLFDCSVGAGTVCMPYGGHLQESPSEGSAVLMPTHYAYGESQGAFCRTVALSAVSCPIDLLEKNPYRGASYAVVESLSKIVAMGGNVKKAKLTFQEYFQRLDENASIWGAPTAALLGALEAQCELHIPAIGGKDSMSGSFDTIHVPPTFISFAVSTADVEDIISTELKTAGAHIYMIRTSSQSDGTPHYKNLLQSWQWFLSHRTHIASAVSLEEGGVLLALIKKMLGNNIGMKISLDDTLLRLDYIDAVDIYNTMRGSLLFSSEKYFPIDEQENIDMIYLGMSQTAPCLDITMQDGTPISITLDEIRAYKTHTLQDIFPIIENTKHTNKSGDDNNPLFDNDACAYTNGEYYPPPALLHTKPKVCIPVFPGTNSEYDTAAMFNYFGGESHTPVFLNHTQDDIFQSIDNLAKSIRASHILVIAGGFSLGDQPGGSGKYIASVLRYPMIVDAIYDLLSRDGLMLGICNGFQALLKSGWLPYGNPSIQSLESATLTNNEGGQHISRIVQVRVQSTASPWLAKWKQGDELLIPISHGEGRFYATSKEMARLHTHIATCYASEHNNPNGSLMCIEGIINNDGKIFGRMGHAERIGRACYKNIPSIQHKTQTNIQTNTHALYQSLAMFQAGLEAVG